MNHSEVNWSTHNTDLFKIFIDSFIELPSNIFVQLFASWFGDKLIEFILMIICKIEPIEYIGVNICANILGD